MTSSELHYPRLVVDAPATHEYLERVERHREDAAAILMGLPRVFRDIIGPDAPELANEQVGGLSLLVIKAPFSRFAADGVTILSELRHPSYLMPVVLANELYLAKGTRDSAYRVMLRHEAVHVEQVIRGDYFSFVSQDEWRAIAHDPTGNLLRRDLLNDDPAAILDFAERRFLQDIYNEAEAYSREVSDYGHRVDAWEAWCDLFGRFTDYYVRYNVAQHFRTLSAWATALKPRMLPVMHRSNFYKTHYTERYRLSFLATLQSATIDANGASFAHPSDRQRDFAVRVPPG